jgi:outer membrane protein OmpA-like peptidoglycan-associated protein
MRKELVLLGCVVCFIMAGCAAETHFGVPNKLTFAPPEFGQTEAAIANAQKSEGAKYCPEKIAKANELGKKAAETYWACNTNEAMALLAQARDLAKEAEACKPGAKVTPLAPAPTPAAPAPVPARQPVSFHSVYFGSNRSSLTPEAKAELDRAAKIMQDNPDVVVELQGNTDSTGSDVYNKALAEKRAKAVSDYLKSKGISANRLKTLSLGKSKPVASNATTSGRAQNRRVDLTVVK